MKYFNKKRFCFLFFIIQELVFVNNIVAQTSKNNTENDIQAVWNLIKSAKPIEESIKVWEKAGGPEEPLCISGDCNNGYGVLLDYRSGNRSDKGIFLNPETRLRYQYEGYFYNGKIPPNQGIVTNGPEITAVIGDIKITLILKLYTLTRISKSGFSLSQITFFQDLAFKGFNKCNCLIDTYNHLKTFEFTTKIEQVNGLGVVSPFGTRYEADSRTSEVQGFKNFTNEYIYIRSFSRKGGNKNDPNLYYDTSFILSNKKSMEKVDFNSVSSENGESYVGQYTTNSLLSVECNKINKTALNLGNNRFKIDAYTRTTKIKINAGDKIIIKATGIIQCEKDKEENGPSGIKYEVVGSYKRDNEIPYGSLMASVADCDWVKIGDNYEWTTECNGELNIAINDENPTNNSGSFIAEIKIIRANKLLSTPPPKGQPKTNTTTIITPTQTKTSEISSTPTVTKVNTTTTNNPQLTNTKPSFKAITILEDNFADNKNRWDVSSKNHIISIEGNRMIYTNNEKKDRVYAMVGVPISIKNNDDYTIEASMQSLTPCANDKLGPLNSILLRPNQSFYGFAIGDQKTDILFSVGNNVNERKVRDDYVYTCIPSYFITSTVAGSTNYIQEWTKSSLVAEGGNVNILKLEKKGSQFNFYVNNRLISSKNSYPLSNDNAIKIVSSSFTKISVNNIRVILTNSEEIISSNNTFQSPPPNISNNVTTKNPVTIEKSLSNSTNSLPANSNVKSTIIKSYKGTITNKSSNLKTKCEMTFSKNSDGTFQLKGETDKVKLIGKWDLKGKIIENNIYIFKGDIILGYEGTDYPLGTSAPFTLTVTINEKSMIGNYIIKSENKDIGTQEGIFTLK